LLREFTAWNKRTARLFACDCAEHVVDVYEAEMGDRSYPETCIQEARSVAGMHVPLRTVGDVFGSLPYGYSRDLSFENARDAVANTLVSDPFDAAKLVAFSAVRARRGAMMQVQDRRSPEGRRAVPVGDVAMREEATWQTNRLFQYLNGEVEG
jgi:hypothetical protein